MILYLYIYYIYIAYYFCRNLQRFYLLGDYYGMRQCINHFYWEQHLQTNGGAPGICLKTLVMFTIFSPLKLQFWRGYTPCSDPHVLTHSNRDNDTSSPQLGLLCVFSGKHCSRPCHRLQPMTPLEHDHVCAVHCIDCCAG